MHPPFPPRRRGGVRGPRVLPARRCYAGGGQGLEAGRAARGVAPLEGVPPLAPERAASGFDNDGAAAVVLEHAGRASEQELAETRPAYGLALRRGEQVGAGPHEVSSEEREEPPRLVGGEAIRVWRRALDGLAAVVRLGARGGGEGEVERVLPLSEVLLHGPARPVVFEQSLGRHLCDGHVGEQEGSDRGRDCLA